MEHLPEQDALLDYEYLQVNYHNAGFGYLLPEMLELFRGQAILYLQSIEQHLQAGDLKALAMEAHTLKGAAGSVGATALAQMAYRLENTTPDTDITTVTKQVKQLHELTRQTGATITAELARLAAETDNDLNLF